MARFSAVTFEVVTLSLLILGCGDCLPLVAAHADDFRVNTHVYSGDSDRPVSANTTLFQNGAVYDFVQGSDDVTVLEPVHNRPVHNRIVVLDAQRQVKTQITTDELVQFTTSLREKGSNTDNPLLKFCLSPNFRVSQSGQKKWLFESSLLSYHVDTAASQGAAIAKQYRTFCDWYARLNCILHPQSVPPFPRLLVNERLARAELTPASVQLRIAPDQRTGNRGMVVRSVHDFVGELSAEDTARIESVQRQLASFKEVTLKAYQAAPRTAER